MPARRHSGFTLLELSIVVTIFGIILAAVFNMGNYLMDSFERVQTRNELDVIEQALMAYRTVYNRLPCPADATLAETDVNYGVEGVSAGACTTGSTYNGNGIRTVAASPGPTANYLDSTNHVVEGAVPFKALNLPKGFLYDGWGRKFAYAVNYLVTGTNVMLGQALNEQCGISVTDAAGAAGARTKGALYALASFGQDGHGGYLKGGTRNNAGSTNTAELTNCHCSQTTASETTYAASYVMQDRTEDPTSSTDLFDDQVRFKERWQMMTYDDMYRSGHPVCTYGFRADGFTASQRTGAGSMGHGAVAVGDINGDGIPDLLTGAWYPSSTLYVIFGTKVGFPNPLPLNSLNGTNGFTITNVGYPEQLVVGDVNGDGIADIVLGQYILIDVIFGHTGSWPATMDADYWTNKLNGTNGFYLVPETWGSEKYGDNALAIGDINGDGVNDIIFDDEINSRLYVLFGQKCGGATSGYAACPASPSPIALADGTHGFYLNQHGAAGHDYQPVAIADINGDGIPDLLIGATNCACDFIDVVFGHKGSWAAINGGTLGSLTPAQGAYFGENGSPNVWNDLGGNLAVGDVNGDGKNEIIMGAANNPGGFGTVNGGGSGIVYIVPSANIVWGSAVYDVVALVNSGNAYWITPASGDQLSGGNITIGDVNGDGVNDMIISCPGCATDGSVFVIYGKGVTLSNTDLNITPLIGTNGFRINCSNPSDAGQCGGGWPAGWLVTGDINGDGIADIVISNPLGTDANGDTQAGYTYVVFGHNGNFPINPFPLSNIQ